MMKLRIGMDDNNARAMDESPHFPSSQATNGHNGNFALWKWVERRPIVRYRTDDEPVPEPQGPFDQTHYYSGYIHAMDEEAALWLANNPIDPGIEPEIFGYDHYVGERLGREDDHLLGFIVVGDRTTSLASIIEAHGHLPAVHTTLVLLHGVRDKTGRLEALFDNVLVYCDPRKSGEGRLAMQGLLSLVLLRSLICIDITDVRSALGDTKGYTVHHLALDSDDLDNWIMAVDEVARDLDRRYLRGLIAIVDGSFSLVSMDFVDKVSERIAYYACKEPTCYVFGIPFATQPEKGGTLTLICADSHSGRR